MPTSDADNALYANLAGQASQGFGEYLQLNDSASMLDLNAGLSEINAKMILADSEFVVKRMEEQGDKFIGSQVAKYAKSGVTFEGSVMRSMLESEKNIRLDIVMTRNNAVRAANRQRFAVMNQKLQAGILRTRATQSMSNTLVNMVGTYAVAKG